MDWSAIKGAIVQAVKDATGLTDVIWQGEPAGWRAATHIDLVLRSPVAIGIDEYVHEFDGVGLEFTAAGQRRFTVSVRIESDSQTPGEESPGHYSSRLRTRLRRPAILADLREEDVALSRIESTQEVEYTSPDDRQVSLAQTDLILLAAENDIDSSASTDEWIETVELSSDTIENVDGTDLGYQVGETIPDA